MKIENLDTCSPLRRGQLIAEAGAIVFFDERLLEGHDLDSLAQYCSCFNEDAMDIVYDPLIRNLPIVSMLKCFVPFKHEIRGWIKSPYVPKLQLNYEIMAEYLVKRGKKVFYFSDSFREQAEQVAKAVGIPESNVSANMIVYRRDGAFRTFSRITAQARLTRFQNLQNLGRRLGCDTIAYYAADLDDKLVRSEFDIPTDDSDDEEESSNTTSNNNGNNSDCYGDEDSYSGSGDDEDSYSGSGADEDTNSGSDEDSYSGSGDDEDSYSGSGADEDTNSGSDEDSYSGSEGDEELQVHVRIIDEMLDKLSV